MLINESKTKAYLLAHSPKGKTQVSKALLEKLERAFKHECDKAMNHHDNKISKGKTLV